MKSNRDRERQQVPRSKIPYDCRVENRLTFRIRAPHTTTRAENGLNRMRGGRRGEGWGLFWEGGPENGVNRRGMRGRPCSRGSNREERRERGGGGGRSRSRINGVRPRSREAASSSEAAFQGCGLIKWGRVPGKRPRPLPWNAFFSNMEISSKLF